MKIVQVGGGFTTEELNGYKYVVFSNLITQMKAIVNAAIQLRLEFGSVEIQV